MMTQMAKLRKLAFMIALEFSSLANSSRLLNPIWISCLDGAFEGPAIRGEDCRLYPRPVTVRFK